MIGKLKFYESFSNKKYLNCLFYPDSFRFVVDIADSIKKLQIFHDGEIDGVAYTSDEFVRVFNDIQSPHRHLSPTKDQLITGYTVYYFPKMSILRDLFDRRISTFLELGLAPYWHLQGSYFNKINKISKKSSHSGLYFGNITGILKTWATMYLVAFIVFCMEVMMFPQIKHIIDYLNY